VLSSLECGITGSNGLGERVGESGEGSQIGNYYYDPASASNSLGWTGSGACVFFRSFLCMKFLFLLL